MQEKVLSQTPIERFRQSFGRYRKIRVTVITRYHLFTASTLSFYTVLEWREFQNIVIYSMAQQPLKSFHRPLMKVSLSNSILFTLFSTRGRVMGDNSIASWANITNTRFKLTSTQLFNPLCNTTNSMAHHTHYSTNIIHRRVHAGKSTITCSRFDPWLSIFW